MTLLLILLASCCFGQDGISPDTVNFLTQGNYISDNLPYYIENSTCAWLGRKRETSCGIIYTCDDIQNDFNFMAPYVTCFLAPNDYGITRSYSLFNTVNLPQPDSCVLEYYFIDREIPDLCSLKIGDFEPRKQSDCSLSESHLDDSCNFYQCGDVVFPMDNLTTVDVSTFIPWTWHSISIPIEFFEISDTTGLSFIFARFPLDSVPLSGNYMLLDSARIIYWFSPQIHLHDDKMQWNGLPFGSYPWSSKCWGE